MIQSVSSSIFPQNNKNMSITFKNADVGVAVTNTDKHALTVTDEFLKHIQEQNDEKIRLQRLTIGALCLAGSIVGIFMFPTLFERYSKVFSKKDNKKAVSFKPELNKFYTFINDETIPVLSNCKTINPEMKDFLQNQVIFLRASNEILNNLGLKGAPNRLILTGPPGTGKSFFAKILAKTINAEYTELNYADINSKWAGEGLENIKLNLENIKKLSSDNPDKKYVLTLNEIDAFIPPITSLMHSQLSGHTITKVEQRSALINYIDDLAKNCPNLIIIGTSNVSKKNGLDGAILSRFSKIIETDFPNKDVVFEDLKMNISRLKNGEQFISENENKLREISTQLANKKYSFRNIDSILNSAKSYQLEDILNGKKEDFKISYITRAIENNKITDGDLV